MLRWSRTCSGLALGLALPLGALVQRGPGGRVGLVQLVQRAADAIRVARPERLLAALQRRVEPALGLGGQPVHPLLAVLFDPVDEVIQFFYTWLQG